MKKIFVTIRQFESYNLCKRDYDFDSRLFDGDTLEPIKDDSGYHLGHVSSSIGWAIHDISNQNIIKKELDTRYPNGFEFVFYYLSAEFCNHKSIQWGNSLSENEKKELKITDETIKLFGYINQWRKYQIIHDAIKIKPINPVKVITELYIKTPRVRKVWKVELQLSNGGVSREFCHEPSENDVQEMLESIKEEHRHHIRDISVSLKFKLI